MSVHQESKPDRSCVPYRRKGLYLALTIPLMLVYVAVFIYLWTFSFVWSLVFLVFYLVMCYFQAYCCVYQDCPYVGGFCPAVAGIMPASLIAKFIYGRRKIVKSKRVFEINVALALVGLFGMVLFPLPWLAKLNLWFVAGYVVLHVVYYVTFGLTVCPACAIRNTGPGGKFHTMFRREREWG